VTSTVESADGTTIAFDKRGSGPPIVLVDGAFCSRTFGPMAKLAEALADRFTVINYDRRGRGESGDTQPYSIDRELEDLAAVIGDQPVALFGVSSGAVLAARAAAKRLPVSKLVLYEPPVFAEGTGALPPDRLDEADAAARAGDRSRAVKAFMRSVGVPAFAIPIMRIMPGVWKNLTAVAHTLPYDLAIIAHSKPGKPMPAELAGVLDSIALSTIVVGVGSKSPEYMQHGCKTIAVAIPNAQLRVLPGQTHNASAQALATLIA
jgi:pimeloyl-ACP methyl ester carboxylesterase